MITATIGIFISNINFFYLLENFLLLTSYNEYLIFFDLIKKKILKKIKISLRNKKFEIYTIKQFFSITRSYIIFVILSNGMIVIWNYILNKCLFSLLTNNNLSSFCAFSYHKKLIVTGDSSGFVDIWSMNDKKKLISFKAHQGKIHNIVKLYNFRNFYSMKNF
uniref:Uncharacterized protein n=1 Tax=Lotharella oceanica TaxID=641309 RepID=A0A7S2TSK4_9EUKA